MKAESTEPSAAVDPLSALAGDTSQLAKRLDWEPPAKDALVEPETDPPVAEPAVVAPVASEPVADEPAVEEAPVEEAPAEDAGDDLSALFGIPDADPDAAAETPGAANETAEAAAEEPEAAAVGPAAKPAAVVRRPPRRGQPLVEPEADPEPEASVQAAEPARAGAALHTPRTASAPDDADVAPAVSRAPTRDDAEAIAVETRDVGAWWTTVDQIQILVGSDPELQQFAKNIELVRDHNIDAQQRATFEQMVVPHIAAAQIMLPDEVTARMLLDAAYDELLGISVLGPFWRDDDITEICVDAWDRIILERNGRLYPTSASFQDQEHVTRIARYLAAKVSDRQLSPAIPIVGAELPGARAQFLIGSIVGSGISITLRKFRPLLTVAELLRNGTLDEDMRAMLEACVVAKANILVVGGTNTGKTTIINALSSFIPLGERIITIEDAYELQLDTPYWLRLQTKEKASADDKVYVTQDTLLTSTLRMRPDRIIVGEVREPQSALVMLTAANTGHDGTMCTLHANSPDQALNFRMADLMRAAAGIPHDVAVSQIASAIDLVVQVDHHDRNRFISEIGVVDTLSIIDGNIVTTPIYTGRMGETRPEFARVGDVPAKTDLARKLKGSGFRTWL